MLGVLFLQLLDPCRVRGAHPGSHARVDLGPLHPAAQGVRVDPELLADPAAGPEMLPASSSTSNTNRTARSRTSSGNFLGAAMTASLHQSRGGSLRCQPAGDLLPLRQRQPQLVNYSPVRVVTVLMGDEVSNSDAGFWRWYQGLVRPACERPEPAVDA